MLLTKDAGKIFQIPTCHVVETSDPLIDASMALYSLSDSETVVTLYHSKSHQLV